ncbi:DUF2946 family protein [Thioalkalivibrio sp. HK1]|uniref:DUF2946 family protein n=1 Tax=Thioalkalivibrio sp. HK1 TaxID=1469245 RepID=UPI0018CC33A3|nr:DUF2946 family protein [Thioalkalivibrio sp. HK1]
MRNLRGSTVDEYLSRAVAKWPDVPAVHGWLALDRRGRWLLRGSRVLNPALIDYISRNYRSDSQGRWFFQNGPQRVYVDLDCTPFVHSLDGNGRLITHTGRPVSCVCNAWMDETGSLILEAEPGPGLVNDRDLAVLCESLVDEKDRPVDDEAFLRWMADADTPLDAHLPKIRLAIQGARIDIARIHSSRIADRLGFDPSPRP